MGPAPGRFTFPRDRRIQKGRDFARAKAKGRRLVHGCLIANWVPSEPGSSVRLGLVINRKVGNAVVRSRARRLLREVFRLHQHAFSQPVDLILVGRPSIAAQDFASVQRDFLKLMRQGGLFSTAS